MQIPYIRHFTRSPDDLIFLSPSVASLIEQDRLRMKWQTGNNWPATRPRRHDSEMRSPNIQTLVLFRERRDTTARWSEPSIWASDLGMEGAQGAPRLLHAWARSAENPDTVETTGNCDNSCCFHHFASGWEFGMAVGTQTAVQISPVWLSKLSPTEMWWTKVKHYCNPMDSLTPPNRRAAFLRMRWLRETSIVLTGLWKRLWNNRDHLVKWEQKKKNVFIYFPFP